MTKLSPCPPRSCGPCTSGPLVQLLGREGLFPPSTSVPLPAPSIGQVHKAVLQDGRTAAVKIRRLGITRRVRSDIRILRFFLGLFQPLFSTLTKNSIDAVIAEFSSMILKRGRPLHRMR